LGSRGALDLLGGIHRRRAPRPFAVFTMMLVMLVLLFELSGYGGPV
jgi:hypothetical protein